MVRWGIVGTGSIANTMASTFREMDDVDLVGVASHSARSESFAQQWGCRSFETVEALAHAGIEAAYIGSSNHHHLPDSLTLIRAGIPVLCEKPMGVDHSQALRMVNEARDSEVLLMEAMWMRFHPFWDLLVNLIEEEVGVLTSIRADFGIKPPAAVDRRWFSREQGGGALLDIGIYPITFAGLLAGNPVEILALGHSAPTGVDTHVSAVLRHPGGVVSTFTCSFEARIPITATVAGSNATIEINAPFFVPPSMRISRSDGDYREFDLTVDGSAYRFEVEEFHRCLADGLTESIDHPLDATLAVMTTLDEVRAAAGLQPLI